MDDIFGDIPALDISTLIDKTKAEKEPTSAKTTGRFGIGPNTIELEGAKADDKKEDTETDGKTKGSLDIREEAKTGITLEEESEEKEAEISTETTTEVDSPIKTIASFLKEKGAIDYTPEEFQDNDDFIADTVTKTIDKKAGEGIAAYKDSLPEEIKQLIDNYEVGVPLARLLESEQRIFEVSSITPEKLKEDSRLQEDIVAAHMANTGWNQTEIDERIKELQDAGIMEKEALRSHTKLIQFEKDQKAQMIQTANAEKTANLAKQKEQIDGLKKSINEKKEFFEGVPTNDVEKKRVFEAITKGDKNGRNKVTQMLSNPDTYVKVAYFLEVMEGNIGKLKTVAKTEAVKDTKKTLGETPTKTESRFGKTDLSAIKGFLKR